MRRTFDVGTVRRALDETHGFVGAAARALGVPRPTLHRFIAGDAALAAHARGLREATGWRAGRPLPESRQEVRHG